jgi:hypothetical protein
MNNRCMLQAQIICHIASTSMLTRMYGVQGFPTDSQEVRLERECVNLPPPRESQG